jgi:uncharacterized protein (DUF3820 family)
MKANPRILSEPSDVRMPWGRYRGHRICELPTSYLRWLLVVARAAWLREGVLQELREREEEESQI